MLDHLVVDGYNVLHAWHRGKGRAAIDDARVALIRELESAAALRGIHCTVVFDGTPIVDLLHASSLHLDVLFAGPTQSADSLIERAVHDHRERSGVAVVTDDRAQGNMVLGWGARCWSSRQLAEWLTEVND